MIWNAILTIGIGLISWALKSKERDLARTQEELGRVTILLNRTREEVAKEYVTKQEVHHDINRVLDRLDRLEAKLDTFIREQRSAIN